MGPSVTKVTETTPLDFRPEAPTREQLSNVAQSRGPRLTFILLHTPINMVIWNMKTTLEIPDLLFRRAKSVAAQRGIPLRQFVTEAVQDKLSVTSGTGQKPWMRHVGKLKPLRKETERVNKRIEEAFEQIDRENWE